MAFHGGMVRDEGAIEIDPFQNSGISLSGYLNVVPNQYEKGASHARVSHVRILARHSKICISIMYHPRRVTPVRRRPASVIGHPPSTLHLLKVELLNRGQHIPMQPFLCIDSGC